MKKISILSILIIIIVSSSLAYGNQNHVFPLSTESEIGKIRNLIERAPENGVYVAVGGERAFRGASMYSTIDHLIIFDISPTIKRFNLINSSLLKAKDKELYKFLRWYSDFLEWKKVDVNLTEQDFNWWVENIRDPDKYTTGDEWFNRIGDFRDNGYNTKKSLVSLMSIVETANVETAAEKIINMSNKIDYKAGNYLFDDKLYTRLHELAINNKITVIQMDLSDTKGQQLLINTIQKTNNKIGIIDLDNLYFYDYMGETNFRKALDLLINYGMSDSSVLILMKNYAVDEIVLLSFYVGFTFANIKSWPRETFLIKFFNQISNNNAFFIDSRLYEKNDLLPLYCLISDDTNIEKVVNTFVGPFVKFKALGREFDSYYSWMYCFIY